MVKKIIIIAALLLLTIIPAVQANGVYASYQDNEFVEVTYELKSNEIAIGGQISFDVTISNLSSHNVLIDSISTDWITKFIDEPDISIAVDNYSIGVLKPYETVLLEVRNLEVLEGLEWYKKGGEYYVDFDPSCIFIVDLEDNGYYSPVDMYYDEMQNAIPLKITNIYDGSDYFEFKWLDDANIMYCYNIPLEHERSAGEGFKPRSNGSVPYEASLKNISSVEVLDIKSRRDTDIIKPYEEIGFSSFHVIKKNTEDMDETQTCYFKRLLLIEDNYHAIEYEREYKVKYLEPPNIDLELIPYKEEEQRYPSKLTLKATNISRNTIENFMICVFYFESEDYTCVFETKDFESNEVLELVHDKYIHGIEAIGVGYYVDGIFYYWVLDDGSYCGINNDNVSVEIDTNDYKLGYMSSADIAKVLKKPADEQIPAPIITPMPTHTPSQDIRPSDTATPENTPTVTITKRQNLLLTSLVVALAFALLAAVLIRIAIIKRDKEKRNE